MSLLFISQHGKEMLKKKLLTKRNINQLTGCWEWTGSRKRAGYGQMGLYKYKQNKSPELVHRISAFLYLGFAFTPEDCVCHYCDNPSCFNPDHLFIGTQKDNMRDASQKGKMKGPRKLEGWQVEEIRKELKRGMRLKPLARKYKVADCAISNIKLGVTYKDITGGIAIQTNRRFNVEEVGKIKKMLRLGFKQSYIAKKYNVHYSTICRINKGNRWKDVKINLIPGGEI